MKKIFVYGIAFILTFTLIFNSSNTYAESTTRTVDTEILNLRSGPGLSFEVTDSLKKGEQLEVVSVSGDWLEVKYKERTGWVASWLTSTTGSNKKETNTKIVSQVNSLNVRSDASIGAAVLGKMNAGDEAMMIGSQGDWVQINLNGMTGWVHADYISEIGTAEKNTTSETPVAQTADTFTVAVDALNVRKKDDLSSKKIDVIYKNETYPVKEIKGNWVRITINKNQEGWVYSFHGALSSGTEKQTAAGSPNSNVVTILTDGTNIREAATTSSNIVLRANAGEQFDVNNENDDWYELTLPDGRSAFVAKWVVSTGEDKSVVSTEKKQARVPGTLQGLTIVLDPGHGGNDRGTTGARHTLEKNLTLKTSELLATKLKAAGATVHLTREADDYVSLRKRVATSHQYEADAFVSIHYDATTDTSISGFTTYYTYDRQAKLASAINNGLGATLPLRNRGAQPGDYFVLRENRQNAVLVELGFLSNPSEEYAVNSDNFREQATHGIYNGLLNYFNTTIN